MKTQSMLLAALASAPAALAHTVFTDFMIDSMPQVCFPNLSKCSLLTISRVMVSPSA